MNGGVTTSPRAFVVRIIVALIFTVLLGRLIYIQLIDDSYGNLSDQIQYRDVVVHPPRGEIYDRNGELLAQNRLCYDVSIIRRDMSKEGFDTLRVAALLKMSPEVLTKRIKSSPYRVERRISTYPISVEEKLLLDELNVAGLYTSQRTVRQYPRKIGGNLLGSISEVPEEKIRQDESYSAGDYIGREGLELAYERVLRGEKGLIMQDKYAPLDSRNTVLKEPVSGRSIVCTIDAELQQFAEELMENKVGAVVAIEPSTGEILVMVSSPSYNPDLMVGRQRGNNYMEMLHDQRQPQFNRSVKAKYPPGSTFKLVQGLIALQEGVLWPSTKYPCHEGLKYGGRVMKCHPHSSPLDLRDAVAQSCNAYFGYVFKDMITNPKYGSVKEGVRVWNDYVYSFGFGRRLGTDLYGEGMGEVPTPEYYDKKYNGRWNWGSVISCSIGQGEMGCTPLQMANLAAIVANRGYYYTPHLIKHIEGRDSIDRRFYERHYTMVDSVNFVPIVEGMWRSVNVSGTSRGAYLEGWDVCGKTGTAQNPNGRDHSTFLSFAPKDNPQIAISVYVEFGGFGSAIAVPIASLIEEMYLTDTITRPHVVERVKNFTPDNRHYNALQQRYDAKRNKK